MQVWASTTTISLYIMCVDMGRGERGFTLVELMTTIVVIGIVVGSISSLMLAVQRTQRESMFMEGATWAAQREIEVLRNNQYGSLTPGENITFTSDLPDYLPSPRSGVVEVSEPATGLRRVDVTVSYGSNNDQRSVKLTSFIGVLGIAQ